MRLIAGVYGPLELCPTGTVARGFRVRHSSSQELHLGIAGVHLLCQGSHGGADRYDDVRNKYVVSNEVEKYVKLFCLIRISFTPSWRIHVISKVFVGRLSPWRRCEPGSNIR